jgi:hypothetical protein
MDKDREKEYTREEILEALPHYYGTTQYYKYYSLFLTDGAQFLAEAARCYWLMDILWSIHRKMAEHGMVVCTLKVNEDRSASFAAVSDGDAVVHRQRISWTDFPLDEIKLYVADDVVMLPSEY